MKVLLEECVDWRLGRELAGHEIKTARQMGWATLKNGELLGLAAAHFDVFIIVDRNLAFQQNVGALDIAVFVLKARTNRFADLRRLLPPLLAVLPSARAGQVEQIGE
jgi:hypothetical protein